MAAETTIRKACRAELSRLVKDWESLSETEQVEMIDRAWRLAEHHPVAYAVREVVLAEAPSLEERQVAALESIARSLEKIVNPPLVVTGPHFTSRSPGYCEVLTNDQWVPVRCKEHEGEPPGTHIPVKGFGG